MAVVELVLEELLLLDLAHALGVDPWAGRYAAERGVGVRGGLLVERR